ncbi:phage tail tape measure protein [Enterobacter kobei]|uniref:phage tail tape measure protein n=1 Tax=Enterobacter kobei TaxID=208224 RepID=UPI001A136EC7|nr:phage tail tape measure protein [Enterobacter kobei]EKY1591230.1 phage tail tape measure protein [Enterobacter kobei]MCK7182623.1 phage tail tape measure protein [Enterobacter kobei]
MSDIATISLRVNTSSLEKGTQELDKFRKAAQGGAGSADELSQSVDETHRRVDELRKRLADSESATKKNASAQDELASAFYKQIDSIKNAAKETDNIAAIRARLHAAQKSGNLIQEDYLALLSAITAKHIEGRRAEESAAAAREVFLKKLKDQVATTRLSREELLRYRAEQLGAGSAAEIYIQKLKKAEEGTARFNIRTAAAGKNLRTLATSLVRSNLGSVAGTGTSLLGNMGALSLRASGLTGALITLGVAYYKGEKESNEFNKQLFLTGSYAGRTTSQLHNLAKAISGSDITRGDAAAALAKVVGTGSFGSNQLEMITRSAVKLEQVTGQSVDATVGHFARLQKEPLSAAKELDEQLHFLTASQLEQITSLSQVGDTTGAAKIAMDAYADAIQNRTSDITNNLGFLEWGWQAIKQKAAEAWDAMLGVGRPETIEDQIENLQKRASRKIPTPSGMNNYGAEKSLDELKEEKFQADIAAARKDSARKAEETQKRIFNDDQKWKAQYENREEQHQRRLAEIRNSYASKAVKDEAIRRENESYQKSKQKGLKKEKTYTDDSATKMLQESSKRLAVLKEQDETTKSLTSEEKRLLEFNQQIADLKQKRILTADQKSLVARSSEIRAALEAESAEAKRIQNIKEIAKGHETSLRFIQQQSALISAMDSTAGLSNRQAQRQKEREQLKLMKASEEDKSAASNKLEERYAKEDELRGDWLAGAKKGWAEYEDSATNVYDNVASVSQGAFTSMSNSLADFFTTGKANFKNYLTTFLKGITQMLTQIALVNSAKSAAGIFGFSGGGAVPQFDSGGYTGAGGKYEPKGIVHGGEFVFTKEATSALGVENLYALMHNAHGYADGGVVGRAPKYGLCSRGLTVNVDAPVSVMQSNEVGKNFSNRKGAESIGNLVKNVVQTEITRRLRKEIAPGGNLYYQK